jgi:tight adherence protein C
VTRAVLCAGLAAALLAPALAELAPARRRGGAGRWTLLVRALARVGARVGPSRPASDLGARLAAAGSPLGLGPGEAGALKAGTGCAGLLTALVLAAGAPGRLGLVLLLAGPAAGFLAPDLWLARRARARQRRVERELADVLELVRVAVDAGLPLTRALAEVGRRRRGLLPAELARTAREIALGRPRREALEALAQRCPGPGVRACVAALERSERLGAPLGPTLAAQARDARAARGARLREAAERAAPKIQLAIALGLVPSVLLLVAAALLASTGR